jgi:hypothetical protein
MENVRQDEHRRADQAHQNQAQRERTRHQIEVRSAPQGPELGATPAESEGICERQGGSHSTARKRNGSKMYSCRVGGELIYWALLRQPQDGFFAVKVFNEGADIVATRKQFEKELGTPTNAGISKGFRYWEWLHSNPAVGVQGYRGGVAITQTVGKEQAGTVLETDPNGVGSHDSDQAPGTEPAENQPNRAE